MVKQLMRYDIVIVAITDGIFPMKWNVITEDSSCCIFHRTGDEILYDDLGIFRPYKRKVELGREEFDHLRCIGKNVFSIPAISTVNIIFYRAASPIIGHLIPLANRDHGQVRSMRKIHFPIVLAHTIVEWSRGN